MTVFVASLFLPYTIDFNVPKADPQLSVNIWTPSQSTVNDGNGGTMSLFGESFSHSPAVGTPATITEHDGFFFPQDILKKDTLNFKDPHSLALSDPHSPTWGSGVFNQPRSQATAPPPASILRHTKHRPLVKESSFLRRPLKVTRTSRETSHDRAFHSAEWSIQPAEQGNGGLRNAVQAASAAGSLKEKTWVGTLGMPVDALANAQKFEIDGKLESEYNSLTVFPSDSDFDGHYSHYCKTILWPVFHYQIPDNPKSKAYEDHSWIYYVKINQAFADRIIRDWKRGDVVWVHDYHLLLVPQMIRNKIPEAQIGFFLHVAFPSSEVFRCLAVRRELLDGMLGANLIGFQTEEYGLHFLQTCSRLLNVEATSTGVQLEDRFVDVSTFPIGIDPIALRARRADSDVQELLRRTQEKYSGKFLIVARDKLDHIRGVRNKMLAFELFLNKYPAMSEKVVLIQVATSTTEQAELDATVSDIVTRINSTHATLANQPLVFLKQDMDYAQYLALMTAADALMITSLREGMNLTSHEFIFCQDGAYSDKKHGSLILSEFTGSASVLQEGQLAVNPWDHRQCAEAIRTAVDMSIEARQARWTKLEAAVMHHTAEHWFRTFLVKLATAWNQHSCRDTSSIPRLSVNKVGEQYKMADRRLFILDYEGTLIPNESPKNTFITNPQRTLDVLTDLLMDKKNIVYVMSDKMPSELDRIFSRVPCLGLIAENGCFLKEYGTDEWNDMANIQEMNEWKKGVRGILNYYQERTEGSYIEERHCSLVYHYADAEDMAAATKQAAECANHINDVCMDQHVHAVPIDHELLIEPMDWSKGTAATQIFERIKKEKVLDKGLKMPDFLLVAGDAREDEVIFRWANKLGKDGVIRDVTTVSVGSRNTEALATLTQGVAGVLSALSRLAQI